MASLKTRFCESWRDRLDVAIYEYMTSSGKSSETYDSYIRLVDSYIKCRYNKDIKIHVTALQSFLDTLRTFENDSRDMSLDDHYTFTVALEYMTYITKPSGS